MPPWNKVEAIFCNSFSTENEINKNQRAVQSLMSIQKVLIRSPIATCVGHVVCLVVYVFFFFWILIVVYVLNRKGQDNYMSWMTYTGIESRSQHLALIFIQKIALNLRVTNIVAQPDSVVVLNRIFDCRYEDNYACNGPRIKRLGIDSISPRTCLVNFNFSVYSTKYKA